MGNTFVVDDMTIHTIVELQFGFLPIRQMFPNLTPEILEENRHWLERDCLDQDDKALLCFQSYIVRTPHHVVLIDSCVGNDKPRVVPEWNMRKENTFLRGLTSLGLTVDDIDFVVCTHLHNDHVGWNTRLENGRWVPTFPKARYLFTATEYDFCVGTQRPPLFNDSVLPIIEANQVDLVGGEHQIGDHIRFLPTPGHTPGHVAVELGRGRDSAVITGDLVHSPIQMRYPELHFGTDHDRELASRTRRAFFERYRETKTLCCTMHFPSPSVGRIRAWDSGFRCEMIQADDTPFTQASRSRSSMMNQVGTP